MKKIRGFLWWAQWQNAFSTVSVSALEGQLDACRFRLTFPFIAPGGCYRNKTKSLASSRPSGQPKVYNLGGPPEVLSQFSYSLISVFTVAWVRYLSLTHCSSWLSTFVHAATVKRGPLSIITFLTLCTTWLQIVLSGVSAYTSVAVVYRTRDSHPILPEGQWEVRGIENVADSSARDSVVIPSGFCS
jgi:hypothetical protein